MHKKQKVSNDMGIEFCMKIAEIKSNDANLDERTFDIKKSQT